MQLLDTLSVFRDSTQYRLLNETALISWVTALLSDNQLMGFQRMVILFRVAENVLKEIVA